MLQPSSPSTQRARRSSRRNVGKLYGYCCGCKHPLEAGCETYASTDNDREKLCEACAILVYDVCAKCGKPGIDHVVKLGQKTYHSDCLRCVMCKENIAGNVHQAKDQVWCGKCYSVAQKQAFVARRDSQRSDVQGAIEAPQVLEATGLQMAALDAELMSSQDDSHHDSGFNVVKKGPSVRCAMCSKIVSGRVVEIGGATLCFHCSKAANEQIVVAQKLLAKGMGEAAFDILHVLAKHGVDMTAETLKVHTLCSKCSEPISGDGIRAGKKTLCTSCAKEVRGQIDAANVMAREGNATGVSQIVHALETQGFEWPIAIERLETPKSPQPSKDPACRVCQKPIPVTEVAVEENLVCVGCRSKADRKAHKSEGVRGSNANEEHAPNSFAAKLSVCLQEEGLSLSSSLIANPRQRCISSNSSRINSPEPGLERNVSIDVKGKAPPAGHSLEVAVPVPPNIGEMAKRTSRAKDPRSNKLSAARSAASGKSEQVDDQAVELTGNQASEANHAGSKTVSATKSAASSQGNDAETMPVSRKTSLAESEDCPLVMKMVLSLKEQGVSLPPLGHTRSSIEWRENDLQVNNTSFANKMAECLREEGLQLPSVIQPEKRASWHRDHMVETFRNWDLNGDGKISEQELIKVFTKLDIPSSDVHGVFLQMDVNKDGHIDYEEFADWLFKSPEIEAFIR